VSSPDDEASSENRAGRPAGSGRVALNPSSLDFFYTKFDHLSYLKICVKYHFFCCGLLY
jgi:hypothetical protein